MRGARAAIGPTPALRSAALTTAMVAITAAVALAAACELGLPGGDPAAHHAGHAVGLLDPRCIAISAAVAVLLLAGLRLASRPPAPGIGALANAAVWATVAGLGVQAADGAFEGLPGGHAGAAAFAAGALGAMTGAVHHRAHTRPTYRSFNLVAMLLAAGCVASMSLTPTGAWWAHNFSTLGTTGDVAAVCFNAALVLSGGAMAAMAGRLVHGLAGAEHAPRRGAVGFVQGLIAVIGLSLAGVGMVPINADTALHNVFASAAGAAFALLAASSPWWVRRMPRSLVVVSRIALALEVAAWVVYDRGVVSLAAFEVVAFALVFVWLIALVVTTHPPAPHEAAERRSFAVGARPAGMARLVVRSS